MSVIPKGAILECSSEGCSQTVRLFTPFRGKLADFRCAEHLPYLTFTISPSVGSYTNCRQCFAQHLYNEQSFWVYCHVCESECDKDPKTPAPEPLSDVCSTCKTTTTVEWTYDPYNADINSAYVYGWYCGECLQTSAEDI